VRTRPDVFVVTEVTDRQVTHPREELHHLIPNVFLILLRLHLLQNPVGLGLSLLLTRRRRGRIGVLVLGLLDEGQIAVGNGLLRGRFSRLFAGLHGEVLPDPSVRSFIVEYELVHVVAYIPQQILGLCEARPFFHWHFWL
jgi:hypothetical protein